MRRNERVEVHVLFQCERPRRFLKLGDTKIGKRQVVAKHFFPARHRIQILGVKTAEPRGGFVDFASELESSCEPRRSQPFL